MRQIYDHAIIIFHFSYNYSRDDEEIYKEFLDIANESIPHVMRVLSSSSPKHSLLKVRPLLSELYYYTYN